MSARSKALPSAASRTVSLFTGKTDHEDPERARDGEAPGRPKHERPRHKQLKWDGGVSCWYVDDSPHGRSYEIRKDARGYHAAHYAEPLGLFVTILEAGDACQAHHEGRPVHP